MPKTFLKTRDVILSAPGVCPFLVTAAGVRSCGCRGFIPAVNQGWGQEECSPSDPFARVPCSGFVGGEEASWGWLKHLPGAAAGADTEFNHKNTFAPQSAQRGQLQPGWLDSLTVSGFSRGVEMPRLPAGAGHISRSVPSLLLSCDMSRCLMPLCRDAAQGFVPPNYLLFNFCFLLKVLPVPGKMSS